MYILVSDTEDHDLGFDSVLAHLEGELDSLASKKVNPFDASFSPRFVTIYLPYPSETFTRNFLKKFK